MFTYEIGVSLRKPVDWRCLKDEANSKLEQLTGMIGQWVSYVEPWKFYNWMETPEGHVSWDPSSWFQGEIDDEKSATTLVLSSAFGQVEVAMRWWYVNDQMEQELFALSKPTAHPMATWEVVLTIAVGLAIAEMTASEIDFDDGLCGLGSGGTVKQILESVRCKKNHENIQTAVEEIVENIRFNSRKRGVKPLFERVGAVNSSHS